MYAVQVADGALRKTGVLPDPVKPAATLADIPVIKAFVVRYPRPRRSRSQDFNEHYKASKMVIDTVQYLAKQGEADAAIKEAGHRPGRDDEARRHPRGARQRAARDPAGLASVGKIVSSLVSSFVRRVSKLPPYPPPPFDVEEGGPVPEPPSEPSPCVGTAILPLGGRARMSAIS
jgi:hypothetical protein